MKLFNISLISMAVASAIYANESINLDKIMVKSWAIKTEATNIYGQELKSADLAEALTKISPSITIQRRSGIANDIILRGQRKDNINILYDGGKIYGACPNRMDPPISHIITGNIEDATIIEGPFDVENFGTLSGAVKLTSRKPSQHFHGNINLNIGKWGYKKASAFVSGGNEKVRLLIGASTQESNQYKDGNGNTLAEQLELANKNSKVNYKDKYKDMKAYNKSSFMIKAYINLTKNQELRLSYTGNRSKNVLYPSTPMDAIKDNSDLYSIDYIVKNLGKYSDKLELKYYNSYTYHPMTNQFRKMSNNPMMGAMANVTKSRIYGLKLKNSFHIDNTKYEIGLDTSKRSWDGRYYKKYTSKHPIALNKSLPNVKTVNFGIFATAQKSVGKFDIKGGLRFDHTKIEPSKLISGKIDKSKKYNDLSGYLFTYYNLNSHIKYFAGIGKSIRVPDAKESHFRGKPTMSNKDGKLIGNPNLKETKNYELDLGLEANYNKFTFKGKLFYSMLKDFIVYNATQKQYQNVDAKIYGLELGGTYFATNSLYFDYGLTYQRGKKDHPLAKQTDKDLPSIPPLKANFGINYDFDDSLSFKAEIIASSAWKHYDSDNGEQRIAGWVTCNIKATKRFKNGIILTAGVDNLFNKKYAISNTYKDLTLISGADGKVMKLNEPGRYVYLNVSYKF